MKKFVTFAVLTVIVSLVASTPAEADSASVKLLVNQSSIDGGFEAEIPFSESNVGLGISGVYNEDDYKILFASAEIGNQILTKGLKGSLGLKSGWGEVEKAHHTGDILNIGFKLSAAYDLSKSYTEKIPVTLSSSVCFSPQPLCFNDSDEFLEVLGEIDWRILEKASIVIAYRYIEIEFKDHNKWEKADSSGYIGAKFRF